MLNSCFRKILLSEGLDKRPALCKFEHGSNCWEVALRFVHFLNLFILPKPRRMKFRAHRHIVNDTHYILHTSSNNTFCAYQQNTRSLYRRAGNSVDCPTVDHLADLLDWFHVRLHPCLTLGSKNGNHSKSKQNVFPIRVFPVKQCFQTRRVFTFQ